MQTEPERITVPPASELDRLLALAADGPLVLEKDGVRLGAIISARDMERFKQMDARRRERFEILDGIGEAFEDVPAEEIERVGARALAEVRAEKRRAEEGRAGGAR